MGFLHLFFNYFTRRNHVVKEFIYIHQDSYYEKLAQVKEKYIKIFYEQTIACIIADAYELFLELNKTRNPFYQNIDRLTAESGRAFFKFMGIYYTLNFIQDTESDIFDIDRMEEVLFHVFEFSNADQQVFYDLKALNEMEQSIYQIEFAKHLMNEVFGESINQFQVLAQLYHCLYNSYESFIKSLSTYIPIGKRLA